MENNETQIWVKPELTIESWTETQDLLGFFMNPAST